MTTALDKIIAYKHDEVAKLRGRTSYAELASRAKARGQTRGFADALTAIADKDQNALICELKRRSPSAGEILPGADPIEIARQYERGGAACLSVLTDGPSFGGSLDDLEAIRAAVDIPILRKDFMIDPWQVTEARASGADAILVIMAAVSGSLASELISTAAEFGMDCLVEIHDQEELSRALDLESSLIGVNNRDLKTMTTDINTTLTLALHVPPSAALVYESGIRTSKD
ncbi:MAG: indole-3-glycerol phosphate synthase TrpC, partial [Hyphomonadaceae bacterium]